MRSNRPLLRALLGSLLFCASLEGAEAQSLGNLLDGASLQPQSLSIALSTVKSGSIVILGENHGVKAHQLQQLEVMKVLRSMGLRVSVGMEFINYPEQPHLDKFRAGRITEAEFLGQIGWGNPSFDFYRDQVLFPRASEGSSTVALNAPRMLTSKVAKSGLESLNETERALLPPNFQWGRPSYRQRFLEMMPHLPNPAAGERYFAAQSIWDDTMAWQAVNFLHQNPEQVLVIVVGEFHSQYGGGLQDRIHARDPGLTILNIAQINRQGSTEDEIAAEINPSSKYGARGDLIWLTPL